MFSLSDSKYGVNGIHHEKGFQLISVIFMLIENGFYDDLGYRFSRKKKVVQNIEDVQDGQEYKSFFQAGGLLTTQANVALQFNTDGVFLFKSSAYKIWPVYIEILDLPPNKRYLLFIN